MKHIFVINPGAGSHDATNDVKAKIDALELDIDYDFYVTKAPGDATDFVKKTCENSKEKLRFYSCGGDGTLNEIASGIVGFDHAAVTVLPCGSGNDFVKYYGTYNDFSDVSELVNGVEHKIDVMKVCGRYSVNVVHFGFDTAVLKTMLKVRRKKIIGGKRAYTTGVIVALLKGMKTKCDIISDGQKVGKGVILLGTVANGKYVGGSYKCAPYSLNDDGFSEVCIVNPVSRLNFIRLIKDYKLGNHIDNPKFEKYVNYCKGKRVEIIGDKNFCISIDGELVFTEKAEVEVIPKALNFVIPKSLADKNVIKKDSESFVH